MAKKSIRCTVILEPLEDGGYDVVVPAHPEICTFRPTLREARKMARDAIRCYPESARKKGEPIPRDISAGAEPRREQLAVKLP